MSLLDDIATVAALRWWTWAGYNKLLKPLLPRLRARWRAANDLLASHTLSTSALLDVVEEANKQSTAQGYLSARHDAASGVLANILTDLIVKVYLVVLTEGGVLPPATPTGLNLGVPTGLCADSFCFPLVRVPISVPQRVKDATAVRQAACSCFKVMVEKHLPAELVDNICKRVMVLHFF